MLFDAVAAAQPLRPGVANKVPVRADAPGGSVHKARFATYVGQVLRDMLVGDEATLTVMTKPHRRWTVHQVFQPRPITAIPPGRG